MTLRPLLCMCVCCVYLTWGFLSSDRLTIQLLSFTLEIIICDLRKYYLNYSLNFCFPCLENIRRKKTGIAKKVRSILHKKAPTSPSIVVYGLLYMFIIATFISAYVSPRTPHIVQICHLGGGLHHFHNLHTYCDDRRHDFRLII